MTTSRQSVGGSVPRHDRVTGRHRATPRRGQQRFTSVRNHPMALCVTLWQSPLHVPAITTTTHQHEPGAIGCKAHSSPMPRDQPSHPHFDAVLPHGKDGCGSVRLTDVLILSRPPAANQHTHSKTQTEVGASKPCQQTPQMPIACLQSLSARPVCGA